MSDTAPFYDQEMPPLDDQASELVQWEWHLNRIAWYEAKVRKIQADRDEMVQRYSDWADERVRPMVDKCAESEAWLKHAMLAKIDADPKAPKTVELPSGVVRSTAGRARVNVVDADTVVEWAQAAGRPDVLKVTTTPILSALKEVLADGEIVPGAELVTGERTVTITVAGEGE